MQVEHPGDDRALESRPVTVQHVEVRPRELHPALEVDDAERFADLPVRRSRRRAGARGGRRVRGVAARRLDSLIRRAGAVRGAYHQGVVVAARLHTLVE